jgi:hypothetical protein
MTSLAVSRSNPLRWTVIGFCLGALCALGARYASDANQKQPPKASKHLTTASLSLPAFIPAYSRTTDDASLTNRTDT